MKTCTTKNAHPRCYRYRAQPSRRLCRPTRLLRLDRHQPEIVQLVLMDESRRCSYATLSHRWGWPEPPKLSQKESLGNGGVLLDQLLRGIPISCLPQVFRDAIYITRSCGLEYLWIDSLCILQDKNAEHQNEDWEKEAVKVGDIYSGGVFNIAATDSQDSEGSLFPRKQPILLPTVRERRPKASPTHEVTIILSQGLRDSFYDRVMDSELLSRGWVYQEALLAPATLFCTAEQMWWSCAERTCSQIFPDGAGIGVEDEYGSGLDFLTERKLAIITPSEYPDPITEWTRVLEHYTATNVTMKDDRLVAIAGTASIFRSLYPEQLGLADYHSGLWSTELTRQLCWCGQLLKQKVPDHRFPTLHHMPSWSPTSFNGATRNYASDASRQFPIGVKMNAAGLDQFGRATVQEQCAIRLLGALTQVTLGSADGQEEDRVWSPGHEATSLRVVWDSLDDAHLARTSLSTSTGLQALVLQCGRESLDGLLLRAVHDSEEDGLSSTRWARCGYLFQHWAEDRHDQKQRADYVQAFQLGRYGRASTIDEHAISPRRWRHRRDDTDFRSDLQEIFIV